VVSALVLNGMQREQTVELFVSQRQYWVEPHRSPRRDVVSTQRSQCERKCCEAIRAPIEDAWSTQQMPKSKAAGNASSTPISKPRPICLMLNAKTDRKIRPLVAPNAANAEFTGSPAHRKSDCSINARNGHNDSEHGHCQHDLGQRPDSFRSLPHDRPQGQW
jgi:hypothetical protein